MRTQIIYKLLNTAGVTALVSTRIYSAVVDEKNAEPYIVFKVTNKDRDYDQAGLNGYIVGYFDIEIYSTTLSNCEAIANAVLASIGNLVNTSIGNTGDTILVNSCKLETESDDFFLSDGSADAVKNITQTYQIIYT